MAMSPECVELHNRLLLKLRDNICEEHLKKIKVQLNHDLGTGNMEDKEVLGVLQILYDREIIKVGEYSKLKPLLENAGIGRLNDDIAKTEDQIKTVEARHGEQSNNDSVWEDSNGSNENTVEEEQGATSEEVYSGQEPIDLYVSRKKYPSPSPAPRINLAECETIPKELKDHLVRFRFIKCFGIILNKLVVYVLKQQCTEPFESIEELIKLTVECCGNIKREDCVVKFIQVEPKVKFYHGIPCEGAKIYVKNHGSEIYRSFGTFAKAGSASDVYVLTSGHDVDKHALMTVEDKYGQSTYEAICHYCISSLIPPMYVDIAALRAPSLKFKNASFEKVPTSSCRLASMLVYKTGAGSGYTEGIIIGTDITMSDSSGIFGVCLITSTEDGKNFARPGDSGSVVYSKEGNAPLGMVFGGVTLREFDFTKFDCTLCIILDEGLQALKSESGLEWAIASKDDVIEKVDLPCTYI